MAYTYQAFESGEADDDLWGKIRNALNGLTANEQACVKIATSDQKSGAARGVIYYSDDAAPAPTLLSNVWSYQVFSTSSDYTSMYNDCEKFLNGNTLNSVQKYYSQITFTNAHDNDAHLVVWWRNMP